MPFSVEQFFDVFRAYNESVWPAQWVLTATGALLLVGVLMRPAWFWRAALLVLGGLWAWMAIAYHLLRFARINPLAPAFAALFLVGAGLFLWRAARTPAPRPGPVGGFRAAIGWSLALYGLIVYPLLGPLFGHRFPAAPCFGLPCPTTIYTIGLLSFMSPWPEWSLLLVPVIWAAVGSTAAYALQVPEDYGLAAAGLWGLVLVLARRKR